MNQEHGAPGHAQKRPGGRSARVRSQVFEATIELLKRRGLTELTVREVAERAGVAESTVYRRWRTPLSLASAALTNLAYTENPLPDTGSLEQDLTAFLENVAALLSQPDLRRLLRTALAVDEGERGGTEAFRAFWDQRFATGRELVARAALRGDASPEADAGLVIETLVGALYVRTLLGSAPADGGLIAASVNAAMNVAQD